MPTRNVVVTDHQQALIETLVGSGRYQNASEVMREGLRLVERQANDAAAKLEALRAAVCVGIESIERGDYIEFPDADAMVAYLKEVGDEALARYRED